MLAIIGILIGATSIGIAIYQIKFAKKTDKDHMKNTKEFMRNIFNYFLEIDDLSEIKDLDEIDVEMDEVNGEDIDESIEQILIELDRYYKQNHGKMKLLLKNVRESLAGWKSIDVDTNKKYQHIIEEFEWLTNDYFHPDDDKIKQRSRWSRTHDRVSRNRDKIDEMLD